MAPNTPMPNSKPLAQFKQPHGPCFTFLCLQPHCLLKPKAGKKQRQFSFNKLCLLASCHLQKLFPLLRTLLFHQGSIHMYFPRKPSLDWAGECFPSPGPPHPSASSRITMAFDTSLPKDARHLSAGAILLFNHGRLSSQHIGPKVIND